MSTYVSYDFVGGGLRDWANDIIKASDLRIGGINHERLKRLDEFKPSLVITRTGLRIDAPSITWRLKKGNLAPIQLDEYLVYDTRGMLAIRVPINPVTLREPRDRFTLCFYNGVFNFSTI